VPVRVPVPVRVRVRHDEPYASRVAKPITFGAQPRGKLLQLPSQASTAPVMSRTHTEPQSRLAGSAYWTMMQRIVIAAGSIDAVWIAMYAALGAPFLAALNVASVGLYAAAFWLLQRRRNRLAVLLIWLEVLVHSALGSLLIGWDSGFHYFLLMFIPAIVVGAPRRTALPMVLVLLAFYAGLHTLCRAVGAVSPLEPWALALAHAVNVALIFGLFYAMTAYYRSTVIQAERRLLAAATTDPLTGLANRSQFQMRAATELAHGRRRNETAALVLADVDFFKRINDELGHAAGDKVLVRLAALMRDKLREVDVLARWGGEEFLALLPGNDLTGATVVAERMRQAVAAVPIDIDGRVVHVTMSFGVALVTGPGDLQQATARADRALYESKNGGRNRVSAAPDMPDPALA
jgi:diguanylate cyclase (GGDEF)-like protein